MWEQGSSVKEPSEVEPEDEEGFVHVLVLPGGWKEAAGWQSMAARMKMKAKKKAEHMIFVCDLGSYAGRWDRMALVCVI
jgi:hypothetical protein